jgi:serine protease
LRRSFQVCFSLLAVITLIAGGVTTTSAHQGTVYMKINRAHTARSHGSSNLYYHGGAIEQAAAVYIVWWGDQWSTGFSSGGYSSAQAQTYVSNFFGGVGGSRWANTTTQYCSGVGGGTTQCGGAGTHPSNPSGELKGTWNDTGTVPANLTQSDIAAEALALAQHFGGVNGNADYMVFTPTGHSQNGFGTSWCAYHSSSGSLSYSYMPYQPDAGAACGMDFVNGNGYFDGFSIVGGHEYAETVTDPYPSGGWLDGRGAEIGDKCAWISSGQGSAGNISLTGKQYAVQSLWSNAFNGGSGGCVLSY